MNAPDNGHNENNRFRGIKPETEEKYRQAIELYRSTQALGFDHEPVFYTVLQSR